MRHNCKIEEDGTNYFEDAIVDGIIEYDDWYDAYIWFAYKEKPFLKFFTRRWGCMDILRHCMFCGEKIYEEPKKDES